jgi:glycosyltransferase involved in cell wall biosynthesis
MIAYVLPGAGIYGGIKVGVGFAEDLRAVGLPVVVATPGGEAPRWFSAGAPVISRERLLPTLTGSDTVLFSLPHDHEPLRRTGARLVFHCQGTDPLIDTVIADPDVTVLTCWEQARRYVLDTAGRTSIDVGIGIGDVFFKRLRPRLPGSVACMSRRGRPDVVVNADLPPDSRVSVIDGRSEHEVAATMHATDVFVAVVENEWFGLPALEAMAAGCVVVSAPTVGGGHLRHGHNCIVAPTERLGDGLLGVLADPERERLRRNGIATAQAHRRSMQRAVLRRLLATGELRLTP